MNKAVLEIDGFEGLDIDKDLTHGIEHYIFRDALQSGLLLSKSVTEFHPVTAGGSRAWEEIVATFRQLVIEKYDGWMATQKNGMPVLINSEKGLTIVVTSGDEHTGLRDAPSPRTKNAKGHVTENFVGRNYDLFEEKLDNYEACSSVDSHQTWILLYSFDKSRSEVRYELSLPTNTALSGSKGKIKICEWQKRIIFPPVSFNDIDFKSFEDDFTDDSDFFDVEKE